MGPKSAKKQQQTNNNNNQSKQKTQKTNKHKKLYTLLAVFRSACKRVAVLLEDIEEYFVNLFTEFVQPTRNPSISVSELFHVNKISWFMSLNSAVTLRGGPPGAKMERILINT